MSRCLTTFVLLNSRCAHLFVFPLTCLAISSFVVAVLAQSSENPQRVENGALCPIPTKAVELAVRMFEDTWKPNVLERPGIPDVAEFDLSRAELGVAFCELELRGAHIDEFLHSSGGDPGGFASTVRYCFPIECDDSLIGAVVVARNADENGIKFSPDRGDFMPYGYYGRHMPIMSEVRLLRRHFGPSATVGVVTFQDAGVRPRFVVREDNTVLSGESVESLKPAVEENKMILEQMREYRALQAPYRGKSK